MESVKEVQRTHGGNGETVRSSCSMTGPAKKVGGGKKTEKKKKESMDGHGVGMKIYDWWRRKESEMSGCEAKVVKR